MRYDLFQNRRPLENTIYYCSFIATCCGLVGSGFGSLWGRDFPHSPDPPLGLPSLLRNGYSVCFPAIKLPGRGVDYHSNTGPRLGMGRVIERLSAPPVTCYGVTFTSKVHFDVVCAGHRFVLTTDCILPMFAWWLIILFKHPVNAFHCLQTQLMLIAPCVYGAI